MEPESESESIFYGGHPKNTSLSLLVKYLSLQIFTFSSKAFRGTTEMSIFSGLDIGDKFDTEMSNAFFFSFTHCYLPVTQLTSCKHLSTKDQKNIVKSKLEHKENHEHETFKVMIH